MSDHVCGEGLLVWPRKEISRRAKSESLNKGSGRARAWRGEEERRVYMYRAVRHAADMFLLVHLRLIPELWSYT